MICLEEQNRFLSGVMFYNTIKVPLVSDTLADSVHKNLLHFNLLSLTLISTFHILLPLGYHTGLPFGKNIWNIYVTESVPQVTLPYLDNHCLDLPNLPKYCLPLRPSKFNLPT